MAVDVGITGGIITGGMGRPACRSIITMSIFSLYADVSSVTGGGIPLAPGQIKDFYQPVDTSHLTQTGVDTTNITQNPIQGDMADPSVYGKKLIKVGIKFNEHAFEKEYLVSERRAKHVITVINLINGTKARLSAVANNIRVITTRANVVVKNLRTKYFGK